MSQPHVSCICVLQISCICCLALRRKLAYCILCYFNEWTCTQQFFPPHCQGNGLWKLIRQLLQALIPLLPLFLSLTLSHASKCITSVCTDLFLPWAEFSQPGSYWHNKAEFNTGRSASTNTLDTRSWNKRLHDEIAACRLRFLSYGPSVWRSL